ncbi:isochorismatase domain-containing protein 2-like [Haemaphysalis longicornis]|uniref:Isochorismatase-like domain-containing protein n=1 Tax=Haemaphysalis longicornis TaxID=44386 RepID=A0A9J6H9R0_HAELO|nr:hypothetical protein HPB48_025353 [Haemaphysalis longicornis]
MAAFRNVGRLSIKTTAIFLIDMQEKFRPMIQYFPQIVAVSQRLLRAGRALDMTVIVTEQYPKGLGPSVPELGLAEFPDIKPIAKTNFNVLAAEPSLSRTLREKGLDSVVLCGVAAHACIQNTALALLEQGFNVHVAVDACSSVSMVDRFFAFERARRGGAYLTTSESIILSLVGGSAHPKFKEVQKLIMEPAPDTGLLEFVEMPSSPCRQR